MEKHKHPSAHVAMTPTDKRAKPLMSNGTMKAFITTLTSVIVLTYRRSNADTLSFQNEKDFFFLKQRKQSA